MTVDQSRIDALVARPSESLNVEIKSWISPNDEAGIAKIVRASLALRNRNGGYLLIGFDDKTLLPSQKGKPDDVRATFHIDKIQGIISRYASELFEVEVAFGKREGQDYPVVVIPDGVRSPVAAKASLSVAAQTLIRAGAVYFRSLRANGTPSTASARPEDWPEIVEICFENREADVGRFLRRQFATSDLSELFAAFQNVSLGATQKSEPVLRDQTMALLADGQKRFAAISKTLGPDKQSVLKMGSWSVALKIVPEKIDALPDQVFQRTLDSSNPQYTGWPVWLDSSAFRDESTRPKVKDSAWESLIVSLEGWSRHIDFIRCDPNGEFYLWRNLEDDVTERAKAGEYLDPILVILRVAETIAVGLSFAKALGWKPEDTHLGFAFRWTGLKGRKIHPWTNPTVHFSAYGSAHDNEVTTYVEISLDTPASAISPAVEQAIQRLFVLFDGYKVPSNAVELWVKKLIERKL